MKFEDEYKIVYVKDDSYNMTINNNDWNNDNTSLYYKGYLLHREDGPAVIWFLLCSEGYFLNGKQYSEDEYWSIINSIKKQEILNNVL